jgi:hypothetical protein
MIKIIEVQGKRNLQFNTSRMTQSAASHLWLSQVYHVVRIIVIIKPHALALLKIGIMIDVCKN